MEIFRKGCFYWVWITLYSRWSCRIINPVFRKGVQMEQDHGLQIISLANFRQMLESGDRLCTNHTHSPTAVYASGELENPPWQFCLAQLPLNTDRFLHTPGTGHRKVYVKGGDETVALASDVGRGLKEPEVAIELGLFLQTTNMVFIRLDISKYTGFRVLLQPLVWQEVATLTRATLSTPKFKEALSVEKVLHTGDGFVLAIKGNPKPDGDLLRDFAATLATSLDERNARPSTIEIHFRISMTFGPTYLVNEIDGSPNYAGEAINETERLISCMPSNLDDLIYFSYGFHQAFRESLRGEFTRMGSHRDKHGTSHRIFSLDYD